MLLIPASARPGIHVELVAVLDPRLVWTEGRSARDLGAHGRALSMLVDGKRAPQIVSVLQFRIAPLRPRFSAIGNIPLVEDMRAYTGCQNQRGVHRRFVEDGLTPPAGATKSLGMGSNDSPMRTKSCLDTLSSSCKAGKDYAVFHLQQECCPHSLIPHRSAAVKFLPTPLDQESRPSIHVNTLHKSRFHRLCGRR